jgi:hypothetical protein
LAIAEADPDRRIHPAEDTDDHLYRLAPEGDVSLRTGSAELSLRHKGCSFAQKFAPGRGNEKNISPFREADEIDIVDIIDSLCQSPFKPLIGMNGMAARRP